MKLAILGAGAVGGALGRGWSRAGHVIAYGVPNPADAKHRPVAAAAGNAAVGTVADAAAGCDAIVLAVPSVAIPAALAEIGDLSGCVLIDATNPIRMGVAGLELAVGFDDSAAEGVARLAPGAAVFKTLNQVGFEVMEASAGFAVPPVMFVAGDDAVHKPMVLRLVADLGFDAVDAGGLAVARLLEPLGMLWVHMAINRKSGRQRAFAYPVRTSPEDAAG